MLGNQCSVSAAHTADSATGRVGPRLFFAYVGSQSPSVTAPATISTFMEGKGDKFNASAVDLIYSNARGPA